jgi:hypothetical protein
MGSSVFRYDKTQPACEYGLYDLCNRLGLRPEQLRSRIRRDEWLQRFDRDGVRMVRAAHPIRFDPGKYKKICKPLTTLKDLPAIDRPMDLMWLAGRTKIKPGALATAYSNMGHTLFYLHSLYVGAPATILPLGHPMALSIHQQMVMPNKPKYITLIGFSHEKLPADYPELLEKDVMLAALVKKLLADGVSANETNRVYMRAGYVLQRVSPKEDEYSWSLAILSKKKSEKLRGGR